MGIYSGARLTKGKCHKVGDRYENPTIKVNMSDRDVLEKLLKATEAGTVRAASPRSGGFPGRKPMWVWRTGAYKDIERIIVRCLPWFGERRRAKANEVLEWLALRTYKAA